MNMMEWIKVDHFTNEPYKKNPKSGAWFIVDYVCGDIRISEMPNGDRMVTKGGKEFGTFKTLKAAKAFAETIH